jgi:hypothetical protein
VNNPLSSSIPSWSTGYRKGPLDIPSDIAGIRYIDVTNGIESAGERIRRELQALGVLRSSADCASEPYPNSVRVLR